MSRGQLRSDGSGSNEVSEKDQVQLRTPWSKMWARRVTRKDGVTR